MVLPLPFGPSRPRRMPGVSMRSRSFTIVPAAEGLGERRGREEALRLAARRRRGRCPPPRWRWPARSRELAQLVDHAVRLLHAGLGLGGAGRRLAAQPLHLAPHLVGQRLLVGGLVAQDLVALLEEVAVAPLRLEEPARVGAAELEHARGDVLQEVAVVAHDDVGQGLALQQALEPEDAFEVEVVRGLVHEQDVRRLDQLAHDGQALLPAAGERSHVAARGRRSPPGRGSSRVRPGFGVRIVRQRGRRSPLSTVAPSGKTGSWGT